MLERLKNITEKKYPYEDLVICSLGEKVYEKNDFIFLSNELTPYIVAKKVDGKDLYIDILTNHKYKEFSNINIWNKCISEPEPLIDILDEESKQKLINQGYITKNDIVKILSITNNRIYEEAVPKTENKTKKNDISEVCELTNINFKSAPVIGREKELEQVIISLAQQTKNPILVGESGVGKTAIFDMLAYMIQQGNVPNFLKNKKIYELNISSLVAGTEYRGTLDKKINKVIDYVIENDGYLLINEIHNIFGTGKIKDSPYDLANILKIAIDRDGLNVIGTTTSLEYDMYFKEDALKRRFDKIIIEEPTDVVLERIIENIMIVFSEQSKIKLDNFTESEFYQIRQLLVLLTNKKSRVYNDKINNPDLVIGIIDKMFAYARINNNESLTIENIVDAIKNTTRIYESHKEMVISELYKIKPKEKTKIIEFKR